MHIHGKQQKNFWVILCVNPRHYVICNILVIYSIINKITVIYYKNTVRKFTHRRTQNFVFQEEGSLYNGWRSNQATGGAAELFHLP